MDTPTRSKNNQIGSSISKFEESPVFDFLNSLSPIKPVKSQHITQTFNPLSFASLPSVFTSPHVRSLKECRLLRRQQLSDPSKPEFSSDKINLDVINEQKENLNPRSSNNETADEPPFYESSKNMNEFAENPNYECSSSKSNIRPLCALKSKNNADYCGSSSETVRYVEESSQRSLYESEKNQIDQSKDGSTCDWENMISDSCDLLIFESPDDKDSYKNSIDHRTSFYASIKNEIQSSCSMGALVTDEHIGEGREQEQHMSTQPGEGIEMMEDSEFHDLVDGASMNNTNEKMELEHLPGFYRGMRRRCLVYEMAGARRNRTDENSASDTLLLQSEGNTSFNNQQLVSAKTGDDTSSSCPLHSIGLHLNSLATKTPKTYKIGSNEASASASARVLIGPSSSVNFHPPLATTGQDLLNNTLAINLQMREFDQQNGVLPVEDACDLSAYDMVNEEICPNSPKKKRRKPEQGMDGETACKRCNCKKSKCLKLYCECFAAGVYCVEPCACIDCFNKPIHEDTVLATRKQIESRNPLAFAPKVIRGSDSVPDIGDDFSKTPASARHKRGCNCKKSGCLKKYCECYQGGVGCSINCRCEGCKNGFGRKDGSCGIEPEVEFEDDETNITENSQISAAQNEYDQNIEPVPMATPLQSVRFVQQPFSSNKKPPRSSFSSFGSSSGFTASEQSFGKPSLFQHPSKYDNHFETVGEDEIPEFLQRNSPISGVKCLSPNQKRISPPHSIGMSSALRSPGLRSNRKLILQSIPSFPSLAQNQ